MSRLFERNYLLEITTTSGEVLTYAPPMETRFLVDNYPEHTVATAGITVYGISSRARELIQLRDNVRQNYGTLTLRAGYGEDMGMIFSGRINNVQVAKDGVSTCIKLYCLATTVDRDATSYRVWGENTPYLEVIRDIASELGAPVEFVGDFSHLPLLIRGRNAGGKSCRVLLDELKNNFDFWWFHTPTRTTITRNGASRKGNEYDISALNGMEGAPRWYANAMEVDVRLNYQLQPGDAVNVTSRFWTLNFSMAYFTDLNDLAGYQRRTGKFVILRTIHDGSLWGDSWTTTAECLWQGGYQ
ncbi:TPA: hypothetical protein R5X29_000699 [Enterobacter sichuanensis]|nr:hypothetical protein [Enterobacter sichuanensis]